MTCRPLEPELKALGLWRDWTWTELQALPPLRIRDTEAMKTKPRALREALGLSLRQTAADLGYDKGAFSRLETGQRMWTLRFAFQWLDYMTLKVAHARRDGFPIPAESVPTPNELATLGPDDARTRRSRMVKSKPKKRARK